MLRTKPLASRNWLPGKRQGVCLALILSLLSHMALLFYPVTFGGVKQLTLPVASENRVLEVSIMQLSSPKMEYAEPLISWPESSKPHKIKRFAEDATPVEIVAQSGWMDPTYYPPSEVDVVPKVKHEVDLYTQDVLQSDRVGELVVRLWINENGSVEKAEVIKTELPEMFTTAAINGFKQAEFSPAKKGERAVKARLDVAWVFSGF